MTKAQILETLKNVYIAEEVRNWRYYNYAVDEAKNLGVELNKSEGHFAINWRHSNAKKDVMKEMMKGIFSKAEMEDIDSVAYNLYLKEV